MTLDKYAPYVLSAFGVTWVVFGAYLLYLRSRLAGLRKRLETHRPN
jgi:CcmD family protein